MGETSWEWDADACEWHLLDGDELLGCVYASAVNRGSWGWSEAKHPYESGICGSERRAKERLAGLFDAERP